MPECQQYSGVIPAHASPTKQCTKCWHKQVLSTNAVLPILPCSLLQEGMHHTASRSAHSSQVMQCNGVKEQVSGELGTYRMSSSLRSTSDSGYAFAMAASWADSARSCRAWAWDVLRSRR